MNFVKIWLLAGNYICWIKVICIITCWLFRAPHKVFNEAVATNITTMLIKPAVSIVLKPVSPEVSTISASFSELT